MSKESKRPPIRSLMLLTLVIFGVCLWTLLPQKPSAWNYWISSLTEQNPTIGASQAAWHMVIFMDPACSMCSYFQTDVFPEIEKRWIANSTMLYTIAPIASDPKTSILSETVLGLFYSLPASQREKLFPTLLHNLLIGNYQDLESILGYIDRLGNPLLLKNMKLALNDPLFKQILNSNQTAFEQLVPGELYIPCLIINGFKLDNPTLEQIEQHLNQKILL